jgi:hypothetical protein
MEWLSAFVGSTKTNKGSINLVMIQSFKTFMVWVSDAVRIPYSAVIYT